MFDFADTSTPEYKNFVRYVNQETNKPHSSDYIINNKIQLDYGYLPKFDPTLFYMLEKESFLTNDECDFLVNAAKSQNQWLPIGQTLPFWADRNTPLINILPQNPLGAKIQKELKTLIQNKFACSQELYCDQIGVVRWPVGSWQMPHIDAIPTLNRVCGSVIYLNDDYEGGETFYSFFDKIMKPVKGKLFAHSPDNEHFHGVTKIGKCTRYTISSTWSMR